ncbi:polysaccharide polymerase [Lactobacillus sp. ESL0703]|uniref:polysaccharide polymerase n=1 Tax=Lactobacillus sp. ESL0703 TaxID=2983218 RepID=UPI0023FA216F|nr:polysaccharide polymerase [Lactobacillus sp. ESL0703]MDF7668807.1 polysaccharide polymerase [Lactobacillus sp. ESL0703]
MKVTTVTKLIIMMSVIVSMMAILSGAGLISNSLSSAIQAVVSMLVMLAILFSNNKFSYSFIFLFLLSLFICLINGAMYMISGTLMITFIYVLHTTVGIDSNKILKWLAIISGVSFGLIVLANLLTGRGANNFEMWRGNGYVFRKSLGFTHPNVAMQLWLAVVLDFCAIKRAKFERVANLAVGILTYIIYTQTQSRTSTYVILLYCLIAFILGNKIYLRVNATVSKLVCLIPIALFVLSLCTLFYQYSPLLNNMLSGRLALYKQFYSMYGIHLLKTPQLESAMFDNGYLQALLAKGIIFTVQLLYILVMMGWQIKKMRIKDILIFTMYVLLGFTETSLQHFELFIPVAILLASSAWQGKDVQVQPELS